MKKNIQERPSIITVQLNNRFDGFLKSDTKYNVVNILRSDAFEIYTIRFEILNMSEKNPNKIEGYATTLRNLNELTEEYVSIHSLLNETEFILFFLDFMQKKITGFIHSAGI